MNQRIARRWFCADCRKELSHRSWPASCMQHSVQRICGYSQCSKEVGAETACCEEHNVLGNREALKINVPPITNTSGEWLFRERLRLGLTRAQVLNQLKSWRLRVSSAALMATEVRDRPVPMEWLMPLAELNFDYPGGDPYEKKATTGMAEYPSTAFAPIQASLDLTNQPEPPEPVSIAMLLLAELNKESAPREVPEHLREAVAFGEYAAIREALVAAAPNREVSVGQFLGVWIGCEPAWRLIKSLPLNAFWSSFHPYEDLLVPEPPKTEEPIATLLPKLLAYHLERETIRALARPDLTEMMLTGDFFTGLARVGALDAIEKFPFLTFCYAMEYGAIPPTPITTTDEADSLLKAVFTTGRRDADG